MAKLLSAPSKNGIQKTLAAELLSTATTGDAITFADVDGIPNLPGVLVIDRIDSAGTATPAKREYIEYSGTSGVTVLITTRNVDSSGTVQTHAVGAIVEFVPDVVWADRIYDALSNIVDVNNVSALASGITLSSPTLISPKISLSTGWFNSSGATITGVIDDDSMAAASATKLASSESVKAYVDTEIAANSGLANIYQNAIINGNFDISQRATTFVAGANNDDVYTLDHWNLISDGNDILDVSRDDVTDLPGSNYAIKLDVETAKRGGIVQFLEAKDAQKFKGKTVSLSFAVKSANIAALRATVLSWSSTADAVTSDVVGTWAATPTWAANWADNATPADLTVTSSWTTVKVENIAIDEATVNNLALVIWTPNEETIGDIVYISQVQLNEGATAKTYQPKSAAQELADCQRYCIAYTSSNVSFTVASGYNYNTSLAICAVQFPTPMRSIPTLVATAADWQINYLTTASAATGLTIDGNTASPHGSGLAVTVTGTPLTAGQSCILAADGTANRLMYFQAEL